MNKITIGILTTMALLPSLQSTRAGSATWNANATSGDWNTAANWTPQIVPTDVATFAVSNITSISVAPRATIGSIVFDAGASLFSIRTAPPGNGGSISLTISGAGITNNSGVVQNLVSGMDPAADGIPIEFTGTATVGSSTTITTEANPSGDFAWGAYVYFHNQSSAGGGIFHNKGGAVGSSYGGQTIFDDNSIASNATFVSDGGSVSGAGGGITSFMGFSDASNAVITANGGTVSGAVGGLISFGGHHPSLGHATLIANGGVDGGYGGAIYFNDYERIDESSAPRVELFGNGIMYVEQAGFAGVDIGSLEGDGIVSLGDRNLTVGRNDLSTTFSGLLEGYATSPATTAAVSKVGNGILTLTGANTYPGTTTISEGALRVANATGSATGSSQVLVNGGTFGGNGSVDGAVTIGTGSGAGAFLEPSIGTSKAAKLTVQSPLTFKADSTYTYKLNTKKAKSDQVIANGVTIESGAQFSFQAVANKKLTNGTIFTAISNTSAIAITGTFANLLDGSTVTVGNNTFQANYEGGDGNDLTLTVVP